MVDDKRLSELLKQVDQAEVVDPVPVDVSRCRRLVAGRQRRRVAVAKTVVASLVIGGCLFVFSRSDSPHIVKDSSQPVAPNQALSPIDGSAGHPSALADKPAADGQRQSVASVADVQQEIRDIERTVELYESRQKRDVLQRRLADLQAVPPVLEQVRLQEEIHRTAAITLDYAHRLANEYDAPPLARAEYRYVLERYSGTRWASEAEEALSQSRFLQN